MRGVRVKLVVEDAVAKILNTRDMLTDLDGVERQLSAFEHNRQIAVYLGILSFLIDNGFL